MDFDAQFKGVMGEAGNGGFITTCICRGCAWDQLESEDRNALQHYADWRLGRVGGEEA